MSFRPSRRQLIAVLALYIFGVVVLAGVRDPYDLRTELLFYTALVSMTFLFLFASGAISESE